VSSLDTEENSIHSFRCRFSVQKSIAWAFNLAAREILNVYKSDTKQAFLNAEMEKEIIYIRPLDWWPEQIPHGYVLQLMKSLYGTRQAARQ
jgi:hypothetical protein